MLESRWWSCTDPEEMLRFLVAQPGDRVARDRRLGLFACACCRRLWPLLRDERSRHAVESAERYADGALDWMGISRARFEAERAWMQLREDELARDAYRNLRIAGQVEAAVAAEAAARLSASDAALVAARYAASAAEAARSNGGAAREKRAQSHLLRDLFGNPFGKMELDPDWIRWNNGCAWRIARTLYDERRFEDLPVLADALEDAGCDRAELLSHCRIGGPHTLGCWALDLVLSCPLPAHQTSVE